MLFLLFYPAPPCQLPFCRYAVPSHTSAHDVSSAENELSFLLRDTSSSFKPYLRYLFSMNPFLVLLSAPCIRLSQCRLLGVFLHMFYSIEPNAFPHLFFNNSAFTEVKYSLFWIFYFILSQYHALVLDGTQQIYVERETERDIEKKKGRNEGRKKERKKKRKEVKLVYLLLWCFGSPVWGGLSLHLDGTSTLMEEGS